MEKIFVDLETIAVNNGDAFETAIANIEYRASKYYIDKIGTLFLDNALKEDEYRILLDEAYDLKDRIIEEVDESYKGKIDYTRLYEVNELNQDFVNYVCEAANDNEVFIIFYYNTVREKNEKIKICNEIFPNCKPLAVKFYQNPYNKNFMRERTNKAFYAMNILGLSNLENCLLIDKSTLNCDQWIKLKGYTYLYRSKFLKNSNNSSVLKRGK